MKWQFFLSDWPVPVFVGVQCIFVKKGLKSCKNVTNCKVYFVFYGFVFSNFDFHLCMVIKLVFPHLLLGIKSNTCSSSRTRTLNSILI